MQRRYLYVLLFGIPALLGAVIATTLLFGAVAGALWLFVFGDNPWPASTDALLGAALVAVCIALWLSLLAVAYGVGRKQEARAALNPRHAMAAAGITAMLVMLVVSQQWSVGNLGPPSDGARCADFCRDKGFAGSGMPPRDAGTPSCSCYDEKGSEAIKVPWADVIGKPRP